MDDGFVKEYLSLRRETAPMQSFQRWRLALLTVCVLLILLLWDASGLDLPFELEFGGSGGFPLRDNWFLTEILHDGARSAAWLLALCLCMLVWWPLGVFKRIATVRRLQFALTTLAAVAVVSTLKAFSGASCPWNLADFGGVAQHIPHWSHFFQPDGGSGRCFPAGHASAGFAFIGGYFAFREEAPEIARAWLGFAILAGLLLGMAQQIRGEHFMSHTLWSGWVCWLVAWALDSGFARLARRHLPLELESQPRQDASLLPDGAQHKFHPQIAQIAQISTD